jgi:hypothetical protein
MKKHDDISDLINKVIAKAQPSKSCGIVDIITFCEDPRFLDFKGQGLSLWPMQRVVLKMFYRGSEGNENLVLDESEVELLKKIAEEEELDYDDEKGGFSQVIDKYNRGVQFNHMLLIMGRRSSKTMMVSIIAAYEAYKLCEAPEGNPQKKYKIAPDKPIHIMNVAVSEAQALDPLFAEIEARLARSPYFSDKVNNESSIKGKIYILTDADKAENARRTQNGISILLPGSIILLSGHSNSATLRGHATIVVLFDEFAHFVTSSGRSSGDEVYNALIPSMKQFGPAGKIVMLSDPRGKDGMFWKLFEMSQKKNKKLDGTEEWPFDEILALQLPTWRMNINEEFSREILEKEERSKDPMAFLTSWGARFVGSEGRRFFEESRVTSCIDFTAQEAERGDPALSYYIHLDPATTSHNYALAMVHATAYINSAGEMKRKIFLDCIKTWRPDESGPVKLKDVEDYVRALCRKFKVVQVTYDSFQSRQTIQNLTACGIRAFETTYRSHYITQIYGELKNLVDQGDLVLYPDELLIGEMTCLLYRILNRGIKRFFDPKSDFRSDDSVDALAGAAYQALNSSIVKSLPRSALAWTGRR